MTDAVEVTQADYDIAERANEAWGRAINGPHVAVLAAVMGRLAAQSPTEDGVERAARAISRFTFATTGVSNTDCGDWPDMAESDREIYRDAARAAISALRHFPT